MTKIMAREPRCRARRQAKIAAMKTFRCTCGNTLYFENSECLRCGAKVGWCPGCESVATLLPDEDDGFRCANSHCGTALRLCHNYAVEAVCNRCVPQPAEAGALCDCCSYNDTIPDLSVPGNRAKWARLEAAKRRLIYALDLLGLPRHAATADAPAEEAAARDAHGPPLAFDFKADVIPSNEFWRAMGEGERVYTGHANGKITINIREADPVEREALRVDLGEAHRTLVGHFRHEIGHYYWELLVRGCREAECVAVFGDHNNPSYADALERHYQQGAPANWAENYVSAYATMHPWEDFAETFATWLDLTGVLDTAHHIGFAGVPDVREADTDTLVAAYRRIGIAMNEMNRTMGLLDFLPEIFVPPVVDKLRFVHQLLREAAANVAPPPPAGPRA